MRNSKSVSALKKSIKCDQNENSLFSTYDPLSVKPFTHLGTQFSHLNEHTLSHGFGGTINAMCACGSEVESTEHFLLRCRFYYPQRPPKS